MKKEKNIIAFFLDFYKRISIPWWLYILIFALGVVYAEIEMKVSAYLVRVNKGELYNSVIIGYVLLLVGNALINFLNPLAQAYAEQKVIIRVRYRLWKKILHLPMKKMEEAQPSSVVSALTNDVAEATRVISGLFTGAASCFGFFRACFILYQYNAPLSLYLVICIPVAVIVFVIVGKLQYTIMKKRYASLNRMTTFFSEHLAAGKYVKAHVMEEMELESGYEAIESRYRADIYYAVMSQVQVLSNSIYSTLVTIVTAIGGAHLIRQGRMEKTGINMFNTYSTQVNKYLAELLTMWQNIMGSRGALSHVEQILEMEEEHPEEGMEWEDSGNMDIVFEHVKFGYGPDKEVLHDLSLRIPAGKTTAIIGNNGSGKSTVMKLMQGFYQPDSGEIFVGHNRIGNVRLSDLHKKFGYVLQNNPLLSGTIRENILYGSDENVTEEMMIKAVNMANADSFIKELPDGYDTLLREAATRLSGGQRQRIAIARALLPDPEYLIMDEAGASLDHDTYMDIYRKIQKKMQGKTIVFIAHDMREIAEADYLIVMNSGSVEACGTQEEVLKTSETYREYLKFQKES